MKLTHISSPQVMDYTCHCFIYILLNWS